MTVRPVLPDPLPSAVPHSSDTEVRLLGLSTALPPHVLRQTDVVARSRELLAPRYPQFERIV